MSISRCNGCQELQIDQKQMCSELCLCVARQACRTHAHHSVSLPVSDNAARNEWVSGPISKPGSRTLELSLCALKQAEPSFTLCWRYQRGPCIFVHCAQKGTLQLLFQGRSKCSLLSLHDRIEMSHVLTVCGIYNRQKLHPSHKSGTGSDHFKRGKAEQAPQKAGGREFEIRGQTLSGVIVLLVNFSFSLLFTYHVVLPLVKTILAEDMTT